MIRIKEELKQIKKCIWGIIILLFIGLLITCEFANYYKDKLQHTIYHENLYEGLARIQKNCGSTFITKKFNQDGLFIFTKDCKGEYCKSDYIPIEECLK